MPMGTETVHLYIIAIPIVPEQLTQHTAQLSYKVIN